MTPPDKQLEKKFLQSIVKPLNDLQHRLVEPFVYSPMYSSIDTDTAGIASAIAHFPEQVLSRNVANRTRKKLCSSSFEYDLIINYNDTVKHRELTKGHRITNMSVYSRFEYCETRGFRFMRAVPYLKPNKNLPNKYDFVQVAIKSIQMLANKFEFSAESVQAFPDSSEGFFEWATLYHTKASREVLVEACNIEFVRKMNDDEYTLVNPPTVKFVVI